MMAYIVDQILLYIRNFPYNIFRIIEFFVKFQSNPDNLLLLAEPEDEVLSLEVTEQRVKCVEIFSGSSSKFNEGFVRGDDDKEQAQIVVINEQPQSECNDKRGHQDNVPSGGEDNQEEIMDPAAVEIAQDQDKEEQVAIAGDQVLYVSSNEIKLPLTSFHSTPAYKSEKSPDGKYERTRCDDVLIDCFYCCCCECI